MNKKNYGRYFQATLEILTDDFIMETFNKDYMEDVNIFVKNRGKSNSEFSVNVTSTKDLPPKTKGVLGFQKLNQKENTYENVGSLIKGDICELLVNEKMIYPGLLRQSNFPKKCPVKAQFYHVDSYKVPIKDFPPLMPKGQWKLNLHMFFDDVTLFKGYWIGKVK